MLKEPLSINGLMHYFVGLVMEKLTTKDDASSINSQLELLTPTLKKDVNSYLLSK